MIQSKVAKQFRAGAIRRSSSAWATKCVVIREEGATARVCLDYRALNTVLISGNGGVGDIQTILGGMKRAGCFTSTYLASFGFYATIAGDHS